MFTKTINQVGIRTILSKTFKQLGFFCNHRNRPLLAIRINAGLRHIHAAFQT